MELYQWDDLTWVVETSDTLYLFDTEEQARAWVAEQAAAPTPGDSTSA